MNVDFKWRRNLAYLSLRALLEERRPYIETWNMRTFLTGVACVGKTTIGAKLANLLSYQFCDLDLEVERLIGTSIERLRSRYLTPYEISICGK